MHLHLIPILLSLESSYLLLLYSLISKPTNMVKTRTLYQLISAIKPKIVHNRIMFDPKVGGEKLVYKCITYPIHSFRVYNNCYIEIPGISYVLSVLLNIPMRGNTNTVVFLRPTKELWRDYEKKWTAIHEWGKKHYPLTNIWLEMSFDYHNIYKTLPIIKRKVEDQKLKKLLRQNKIKFTINNY